jgi:PAS domain S-box-containing protein
VGSGDRPLKWTSAFLSKQEILLRTITDNIPDNIFMLDREHRLRFCNPSTVEMVRAASGRPELAMDDMIGGTALDSFGDSEQTRQMMEIDERVMTTGVPELVEDCVSTPAGPVFHLTTRTPYRDAAGKVIGVIGIARDITERKLAEDERMAALQRQRDTLIREVHHRIKNHLQGVIGLLRNAMADTPSISGPLETAIGKIRAIAMVYGMPGRPDEGRISLPDLVRLVAESSAGPVGVEFRPAPALGALTMPQEEAVPVALVANELVANALKHLEAPDRRRPVRVSLSEEAGGVRIEIAGGPSRLPPGFDYARGVGIGNGLELVSALMAGHKARLTLRQSGDEVVADLRLARDGLH